MRLDGKVALITGAAAGVQGELMGFGGASAWRFVREGAKVVLTDVNEEQGRRTEAQIREAGFDARFERLDVTSEQDWIDTVKMTVSTYGKLDVLVNNAGTSARYDIEDTTVEVWDGQMAVHTKGAFLGIKHCAPEMRRAGGGSIINMSSVAGIIGMPTSAGYQTAKGALRMLSKAAAIQYARDGIRVNSIHPGLMDTPLNAVPFSDPAALAARLKQSVPMGRVGNAEDVASGVLFLASDEASYITGAELIIDGGMVAQ